MVTILLDNARVIDGTGAVAEDRYVAIEDGRIREIGASRERPANASQTVIDLAGRTLLPGFIDCHVHLSAEGEADTVGQVLADDAATAALRMARNARRTLAAGVTTVRDCGARDHYDFGFRRAVREGVVEAAPRLLLSGQPITMTGGHCWQFGREANGPDEVRRAAREQLRAGADCIKIMATGGILTEGTALSSPQLEEEEMRAAFEEADKAGKLSAAHAHGATGVKNAIRAGVHSIEHGYFIDDEAIDLMLRRGTYLVPTSAAVRLVVEHGKDAGIPCSVVAKAASALDHHVESCRKAWRAGVKLAMGTDAGTPYNRHGGNLRELAAMTEIGLSPMESIVMATRGAAELLRLDAGIGTIEPGKQADLVVADCDPLADIGQLADPARIWLVLQAGAIVHDNRGDRGRDRPAAASAAYGGRISGPN